MDDKNNELIDFSNQPLGLMAQEGAKIEDNLNKEMAANEEARKKANAQENPFAGINETPVVKEEPKVEVTPTPAAVETPVVNPEPTPVVNETPVVNLESSSAVNETSNVEVQEAPKPVTEEERKQQLMNELTGGEVVKNDVENQPPSWGIFVFLIFIAVIGGAIFLFKPGNNILGTPKDKSTLTVTVDDGKGNKETTHIDENGNKTVIEKETAESEKPQTEEIKNYALKESYFIAMNLTITQTDTGVVDLENMTGKFTTIVNVSGRLSHNVQQYCDYKKKVCYIQDYQNKKKYTKEVLDVTYLNPDERYQFLSTLGTPNKVRENVYTLTVPGSKIFNMIKSTEYIDAKKLKNNNYKIEYTLVNNRLSKLKWDLSGGIKDVKQLIFAQEYSKFNENEHVVIPPEVIKNAK
jgi:hypothetical protein